MYKLLIVEDEPLARHVIKALVLDNFEEIQVVAEAETGKEAIDLSRKYEPDIVLMDIRIPGIDGIEASRQIMGELSDTKILILTAYDDFNYIQQALNIGVKGYLLKPFEDETVVQKITEILEQIKSTRISTDLNKKIENSVKIVKPFIQKELVTAFISEHIGISEINNYISFIDEEIEAGYFMLISYDIGSSNHIHDAVRNKIIRDKVNDVVLRFLPEMKKCLFGQAVGNTIVAFLPVDPGFVIHEVTEEALVLGREIKRKVNVIAGVDVSIGLGNPYRGIQNFKLSYCEAFEALKKAAFNSGIVAYRPDIKISDPSSNFEYPVKLESEILDNIRMGHITKAKEAAEQIVSQIFRNCSEPMRIKDHIGQLITLIKRTLQQIGVCKNTLNVMGILMESGSINDLEELLAWSRSNIFLLIHQAEELKQNKDSAVMDKILSFINNNFNKDITLDSLAEEVGLSPQYISRLFKEEFGENFVDYFTKKRINFARELLMTGNKSIGEIGLAVGYGDVNYFCRVFKKVTGLTPKQYKLNNMK